MARTVEGRKDDQEGFHLGHACVSIKRELRRMGGRVRGVKCQTAYINLRRAKCAYNRSGMRPHRTADDSESQFPTLGEDPGLASASRLPGPERLRRPPRIYDSEINVDIRFLPDGSFAAKLGDDLNGYLAEARFTDWSKLLGWFREQAVHHFPASEFPSFTTDKSRLVLLRSHGIRSSSRRREPLGAKRCLAPEGLDRKPHQEKCRSACQANGCNSTTPLGTPSICWRATG
jgi:hypothetical protein